MNKVNTIITKGTDEKRIDTRQCTQDAAKLNVIIVCLRDFNLFQLSFR